jgi:FkbM family methyltransferase
MSTDVLRMQLEELLNEPLAAIIAREQQAYDDLTGSRGSETVLFGAGRLGRKALSGLRRIGVEPLAFCDSNPALWDTRVDGVLVMSPEAAARVFGRSATFVITIWGPNDRDTMAERRSHLVELGCVTVVPFAPLFWKNAEAFGPYYAFDLPHRSAEQAAEIRRAFSLWADDASQAEFVAQLKWRLHGDFGALSDPVEHKIYFPEDLVDPRPSEVFIDCGAYDGDSIRSLLESVAVTEGQVVAFEPDPNTFRQLQAYVGTLSPHLRERILLHQAALGERRGSVQFDSAGTEASAVGVGTTVVDCLALDDVLADCSPTYIKMDIEGSEVDALAGAGEVIRRSLPVLAICVYHHYEHPWRIPTAIAQLSDQYRFYLRPHRLQGWDLVCYAVPVERLKHQGVDRN